MCVNLKLNNTNHFPVFKLKAYQKEDLTDFKKLLGLNKLILIKISWL